MKSGPADVDLIKTAPDGPDAPVELPSRNSSVAVVILCLALVLAVAGGYFYWRRGRTPSGAAPQAKPAEAVKVQQETAPVNLPPLDSTDALVRELVSGLSSHPVVAAWLTTDRLIVNFVTVTSRIADGKTSNAELKAIGPVPAFRVRETRGRVTFDPASYKRYDRYAQAVGAIDASGAARVYRTLKPRIDEADRNFGGTGTFDAELERALVELLRVPVVSGDVALRPAGVGYAYADPRLESLSPAQKQLLRMGPENVRTVQGKLREIALALGIPDSRLPPAVTLQ
jgi:hypothetical protein